MKHLCMTLLVATALASCSSTESRTEEPADSTIRIYTGIDTPVASRAVVTQDDGLTNVKFVRVDGTQPPTDFSAPAPLSGNVAAITGEVAFSGTAPEYNMNDQNAYFIAYHPAGATVQQEIVWQVDGHTDLMRTNTVWSAGRFSAPNSGTLGTKLILNHQLAQIEVVCQATPTAEADLSTVRAAWGKITKIEFLDAPTTMVYALNGLAIAPGTTLSDFALLADYTGTAFAAIDIPANGNTTVNARAMLAPVTVGVDYSFRLRITAEGPAVGVGTPGALTPIIKVSLNGAREAMKAGKTHKVVLTFKADTKEIAVASSTVDAWTAGSGADNEVEKP